MAFKWSHFKKNISEKIIELAASKCIEKDKNSNKVLIGTLDALGDNLVKIKTISILAEYYGKKNTYILCKDKWQEIFKRQGFNVIADEYKSTIKRACLYRKLNKMNFHKIIFFEHTFSEDRTKLFPTCDLIIPNSNLKFEYILDLHVNLLKMVIGKDYSISELRPNIKENYLNKNINNVIAIGIGASNISRTLPVNKMVEIIDFISEKYPEKKIVLLGSGKRQAEYTKKLLKITKAKNIEDKIDSIGLMESLEYVANADLFIGYDSGLTNAAFVFRTKYICLHWGEVKYWWHNFENCETIIGDGKDIDMAKCEGYGTNILNSIKLSQIEESLERLNIK